MDEPIRQPPTGSRWLTKEQVAARLGFHPQKVWRMARAGELDAFMHGRHLRISEAAVEQFIARHRVVADAAYTGEPS